MLESIEKTVSKHNVKTALIAYSGGIDSHVLLHLLTSLQNKKLKYRAIHINHQICKHATKWQQHCQQICKKLNVEFIIKNIRPNKNANEADLRTLRYAAIKSVRQKNEFILTGHNKSDQAETVLLQLLRGAGIKGLAAMPECSSDKILRPLLNFTRQQIANYAKQNKLNWIEDDSNSDTRFNRNFLRNNIIPELQLRWPSLEETLSRSTQHCADADNVLSEIAAADYNNIVTEKNTLPIDKLVKLSNQRQTYILRYWIKQLNLPLTSQVKIEKIQTDVLAAKQDANPLVTWDGAEIRRYQNELFAMLPLEQHDNNLIITWDPIKQLILPHQLGVINALPQYRNQSCEIRFRQGGERIKLDGRAGTHELKKLMQEWNVPPWLRDRIPLLYVDQVLTRVLV